MECLRRFQRFDTFIPIPDSHLCIFIQDRDWSVEGKSVEGRKRLEGSDVKARKEGVWKDGVWE